MMQPSAELKPIGSEQSGAHMPQIRQIFQRMRAAYRQAPVPSHAERIERLASAVRTRQDEIAQTINSDFGNRSVRETKLAEIPTSIFVCETGGMVVISAGTTGYNATLDPRYPWMRQKRLQGSLCQQYRSSNLWPDANCSGDLGRGCAVPGPMPAALRRTKGTKGAEL